jgi:hypothetical protein
MDSGLVTALHGMTATVTYGGSLASGCWSFPQETDSVMLDGQVNPGPQSDAAVHGTFHCGAQALHIVPASQSGITSAGTDSP